MISEIRFTLSGEDGEQKLDHKNDNESLHVSTLRVGQHGAGAPRAPGLRAPGKTTPAAACAHPPRRGPRRTGSTAWAPLALSSPLLLTGPWAAGIRPAGTSEPTNCADAALLVWAGGQSTERNNLPRQPPFSP